MATNADIQKIVDYFGSDSSIYRKIVFGNASDSEISYALSQIPRMKVDSTSSGTVLGWTYEEPVYMTPRQTDDIQQIIDSVSSNSNNSSYGGTGGGGVTGNFPISFGRDSQTGQAYIEAGKKGLGETLKAVADRVSLGVTGINIGAKLGKAIDQTLYNFNPEWWDAHLPTINPDTWVGIAGQNEAGKSFIRTLFDIKDDGTTTAYIDERIFAQYYQLMRDSGVWGGTDTQTAINIPSGLGITQPVKYITSSGAFSPEGDTNLHVVALGTVYDNQLMLVGVYGDYVPFTACGNNNTGNILIASTEETAVFCHVTYNPISGQLQNLTTSAGGTFTYNNKSVKVVGWATGSPITTDTSYEYSKGGECGWATFYCDSEGGQQIEGFRDIDGATQYPPDNITGNTLNDVLQQLKQNYPDLFQNPITENTIQPDGTTQTITYIPIPWQINNPSDKTQIEPITQTNPTQTPEINPDIAPDVIINQNPNPLDDTQTDTNTDTPLPPSPDTPNTGTGNAPTTILPTGSASSLWAIYNPTHAQINAFGGWLWSSDFVEQLKKLFNDPMQAIIGVHKVFATPITGGERTIVCGYLDSGVSSKIVTSQYTTVDCGSVSLNEYFGNVFDYPPHTSVKIYLPFIGIVPLDVAYIMRSTISIEYKVDVLTGACLANISVSRDGSGGIVFSYGGSCICSYPISSGSYTGIVSGALSLLAGVAGTLASGGSALPAVMGTLSGIGRVKTDVQHSGQFSGAAGAMGSKIPYLIIERPQTRISRNIEYFSGIPSNQYSKISDCNNFVRVEKVHLIVNKAFDSEVKEIEELLINGVLLYDNESIAPQPQPTPEVIPITITRNGTYNKTSNTLGYNPVIVNVPNTYTQADEGKVVSDGALVTQTEINITQNGTYDTTENNIINVNVSGGGGGDEYIATIGIENDTLVYNNATIITQPVITDSEISANATNGLTFSIASIGVSIEFDLTLKTNDSIALSFGGSNTSGGVYVIGVNRFHLYASGARFSATISLSQNIKYRVKIILKDNNATLYIDGVETAIGTSTYVRNSIGYVTSGNAIGVLFNQSAHSEYSTNLINNMVIKYIIE